MMKSVCNNLYYFRIFVLIFVSEGVTRLELDEETQPLIISFAEDLETFFRKAATLALVP